MAIKKCPQCSGMVYKYFQAGKQNAEIGRTMWTHIGGICVGCKKKFTVEEFETLEDK